MTRRSMSDAAYRTKRAMRDAMPELGASAIYDRLPELASAAIELSRAALRAHRRPECVLCGARSGKACQRWPHLRRSAA